ERECVSFLAKVAVDFRNQWIWPLSGHAVNRRGLWQVHVTLKVYGYIPVGQYRSSRTGEVGYIDVHCVNVLIRPEDDLERLKLISRCGEASRVLQCFRGTIVRPNLFKRADHPPDELGRLRHTSSQQQRDSRESE